MDIEDLVFYSKKVKLDYEFYSDDKLIETPLASAFIKQIKKNADPEYVKNEDCIFLIHTESEIHSGDIAYPIAERVLQALTNQDIVVRGAGGYFLRPSDYWKREYQKLIEFIESDQSSLVAHRKV